MKRYEIHKLYFEKQQFQTQTIKAVIHQMKKHKISVLLVNSMLVLCSIVVTIVGIEILYRFHLYQKGAFEATYRVGSFVYGIYDEYFGIKYKPNKKFTLFYIKGGKVTFCPEAISISNKDAINGKTTIDEYNRADVKILTFGDSFTHWNQNGYTWPDLLQENLREILNKDVAVLNYGRGTYGVLQMFDLAQAKIIEHQPDLVIFAFITDDLTRNRWWTKALNIDGYTRPLLFNNKEVFDLMTASDEYIVNPSVNLAWCKKSLTTNKSNPILDQVNKQYNEIRKSTLKLWGISENYNSLFSLKHLYIYNRLLYGTPFWNKFRAEIPRIKYKHFKWDKKILSNIESIKHSKTPYILFHLPRSGEIENSKIRANRQEASLLTSLEEVTGKKVIFLHKLIYKKSLPEVIDLRPHDGHPNFAGLKLYADTITNYVKKILN